MSSKSVEDLDDGLAAGQRLVAEVAGAAALGVGGDDRLGDLRQRFLQTNVRGHGVPPIVRERYADRGGAARTRGPHIGRRPPSTDAAQDVMRSERTACTIGCRATTPGVPRVIVETNRSVKCRSFLDRIAGKMQENGSCCHRLESGQPTHGKQAGSARRIDRASRRCF